ncbi:MAG TPA: HAD-IA family hydrolase [Gammaproteobacteria bacterium]|nr:HAD-IA family hydrolase [Gammaproteobacteria bacterium]
MEAVLFDLDGTLADTAPDLVAVLTAMLAEQGRPPMPYAVARNEVSNGSTGLVRLGFGTDLGAVELEALRRRFIDLYASMVCIKSRLFRDLHDLCEGLYRFGTPWGVVTNKPQAMTVPLLEQLGVAAWAGTIVSGDQLPQRKPHPAPLLLAAEELGVDPCRCIYVGDAPRDIEAGRAAGMRTVAAGYGYIRPQEDVLAWGADRVVRRPRELASLVEDWTAAGHAR